MRVKNFEKHQSIKLLMPTVREFISRQEVDKITSTASKKESFCIDTLIGINKITECLDQIYFSIELLSGFRKKKDSIMNRHDYVIFMIENFYLRITSIFDRALRLTNFIFDIGIPERECRVTTIINNTKIKGTDVATSLKALKKFSDNFKQIRNNIAHSKSFEDKDLNIIGQFYYIIDNGDPDNLKRYSHIYKTRTDNYIKDKKIELNNSANEVYELITRYLDSLTPYINKKTKHNNA